MPFHNRNEAADRLTVALQAYKGRNPLILAIPRGAVPMGQRLARALDGELDVVLVRKLRAPFNPEFALGSIDESGWSYIADYAESAGGTPTYLARGKAGPARHHQETARTVHAAAAADRPGRTHRDRGRRRAGDRGDDDFRAARAARTRSRRA